MKTIEQTKNIVKIEGIVSEIRLEEKEITSKRDGNKFDAITGQIVIKVKQDINGVEQDMDVPVEVFATKMTKKGGINPAYTAAKDVKENFISIAALGGEDAIEKADRIRITNATIDANEFMSRDGNLINNPVIRASFFNKIKKADCMEKATFESTIIVKKIKDEVDREGDPTGRLIVSAVIVNYGPVAKIVDFVVSSKNAIEHIQTYWNEKDTVVVAGKVNYSVKTETKDRSVGFGEPIKETKTTTVNEFVITSGSASGLDEDEGAYSEEDITSLLKERQARLNTMKESPRKVEEKKPSLDDFSF